jgi:UDP-glucuronate 4-epimerase
MRNIDEKAKRFIVTGAAGFIGFHIARKLLEAGHFVTGIDNLNDYYDIQLKKSRLQKLNKYPRFNQHLISIETRGEFQKIYLREQPHFIFHFAAQAGVRYSVENPRAYLESNILGTFEILEAIKNKPPLHTIIASSSSVYGMAKIMPFSEKHKADSQISFYAASKKSVENLAHSFSHIHNVPITMLRFFTVYGEWGRPDMALFKFTKAIFENAPIDVYNGGEMMRDFTYIDDVVYAATKLINKIPGKDAIDEDDQDFEEKSIFFRVLNIGNSNPQPLMKFIRAIESSTGNKAKINYLPMQEGDVVNTWADTTLLESIIGTFPKTDVSTGVSKFVDWYKTYYL